MVALCTKPGRGISDFMSTLIYNVDVFKPLHVVIGFAKKKRVLGSQTVLVSKSISRISKLIPGMFVHI